jgi:hypothetical protein
MNWLFFDADRHVAMLFKLVCYCGDEEWAIEPQRHWNVHSKSASRVHLRSH